MSYHSWHVGMKVVCQAPDRKRKGRVLDGSVAVGYAVDPAYPKFGKTYTIRNINEVSSGATLLLLDEVRNDHLKRFIQDGLEPGFDAKYFTPASGVSA